jgi:protein-disulfide isomerase
MKQKSIPVSADGIGIDLGNPAATHTLIKVCNPYCGPCARMHPKIEKLIEENENIKAKIIFTAPSLPEHPAYKPVSHLLAIASQNNEALTRKALDDWYLVKEKNYETFAAKHSMNGELKMQDKKIDDMFQWCETTGIQHTPTLFINGRQLPDAYSIEDLQYFLLE